MRVKAAALAVTANATSRLEQAQRLIRWLNENFAWTSNDYQNRTPEEILARGHGHCGEHAQLLAALLTELGIPVREVREIFLMPPSDDRKARSVAMMERLGPRASVFGYMHNDHRWLEIDLGADGWYPADSTMGAFGQDEWVRVRLGFGARPATTTDVLVPFAILTLDASGTPTQSRSEHYLTRAFDEAHGGRLSTLPVWSAWCDSVRAASLLAVEAFAGRLNLHEHTAVMEAHLQAYRSLQAEALASGCQ